MIYLATYFDKNYLSRGLVLYDSLVETESDFILYVLCLDADTADFFKKNATGYDKIRTISLAELETVDAALLSCKDNRNAIEYYFTISPCLPRYLLQKDKLPHICTLDADILFLDSPRALFNYLDDYSVVVTPHKFSPEMKSLEKFGRYNVSFQIFKNDDTGNKCLNAWRDQCITWCGDHFDEANNRYADQKYLDDWTTRFPGKVKELYDPVSGLAPWNLNHYRVELKAGRYFSNGERILFYHFHHFKLFGKRWAANGLLNYEAQMQEAVHRLYLDYWNKLSDRNRELAGSHTKDASIRIDLTEKLIVQLLRERCLYLRVSREKIVPINMNKFPNIVKRLLLKLYAPPVPVAGQ